MSKATNTTDTAKAQTRNRFSVNKGLLSEDPATKVLAVIYVVKKNVSGMYAGNTDDDKVRNKQLSNMLSGISKGFTADAAERPEAIAEVAEILKPMRKAISEGVGTKAQETAIEKLAKKYPKASSSPKSNAKDKISGDDFWNF